MVPKFTKSYFINVIFFTVKLTIILLIFSAVTDVEIHQVNGFIHSKRVRTRRSEHSKGILEPFKRSYESVLESNIQNWENSFGSIPDGPVFDDKMSVHDISTQNKREVTVGEGSLGTLIQPDTENPFSLAKISVQSENISTMSFENSTTQPKRERKTHTQSTVESDIQILTKNTSSLHQYSNGTAESPVVQAQYKTLNNTAVNDIIKDTSSENITRNLNPQFLHNNSRIYVQKNSNDSSSVRRNASTLPSQSLENTIVFANMYGRPTLPTNSVLTSNHEAGVFYSHVLSNSNNNGSTLPSNTSVPTSPSYLTISTTKPTTPFLDLNENLTEYLKPVDQAVNNTMYTGPSNSSEYNLKHQTGKLSDREPIYTLIPEKLHTVPRVPKNISSFILPTVSETKNKAQTSENGPSLHSQLSVKSTTSTTSPPLFYLSYANISIESFPRNLSVTSKSTESGNVPETITESSNTVSVQDFPQVSPVPDPTAINSSMSLVTPVLASKLSSFISPMKIPESVVTYPVPIVPSAETITSSAIVSPVPSVEAATSSTISRVVNSTETVISDLIYQSVPSLETVTSRIISSTGPSVGTADSSPVSSTAPETVPSSTISNTVPSLETITSNSITSTLPSVGTVTSSRISSTVPETVTSSTISNTVPSLETRTSSTISSPVSLVKTVSSNTVSSTVPSVKTVTSSTISNDVQLVDTETSSTISSHVPSVKTAISNTISNYIPSVKTKTSSTISNFVPSVENIISNIFSSAVPSAEPITSSTISSPVPSVQTVTTSAISTPSFSKVPSINYSLATEDPKQINEFQVGISGKNQSSHRNKEDIEKSPTSLSDNRNTTSLNVTHEVITLTCE
jgi:hypothetical protein